MRANYCALLRIHTTMYLVELIRNRSNRRFATFGGVARRVVELAVLVIVFVIQEHMFNFAHRLQVLGSKNILVAFTFVFVHPVIDDNKCV